MTRPTRSQLLVASLVLNALLSLAAIGWIAWVTQEPRHWFPGAYEQPAIGPQGPSGEAGPRGARGPRGFPGPPGSAGASADVAEVEQLRSDVDDLQSTADDLQNTVSSICDAFSAAYTAANSATEDSMFELSLAC
jgi:hypothetical protein